MFIFVGLGNPGSEYASTRHNVGFMLLDYLHKEWSFPKWRSEANGLLSKGRALDHDVVLFKPKTFMNLSGKAVLSLMNYYKFTKEDLFVFHDDIELAKNKVKLKFNGGTAGHNGLKSIKGTIVSDFYRLRIGIGRPDNDNITVSNFVLSAFSSEEIKELLDLFSYIDKNIDFVLEKREFTL